MFEKLQKLWEDYGFEILVGLSLLVIVILALFRIGKKGTWNDRLYSPSSGTEKTSRRPPQESRGEVECRRVLERFFGKPFPKARPDILRNPVSKDFNLELDCYNPELKIACEYNGTQHYNYIPFFHKTRDAFMNQKYRDHVKRDLCAKNGIRLIEVPYTVRVEDIETYVLKELEKLGYR